MSRLPRIVLIAVMLLVLARPAHASSITNGGFETGDTTGWLLSSCSFFSGVDGVSAHTDFYGFGSGEFESVCTLSQDVPTTVGQLYNFLFWLSNDEGTPNFFEANFGALSVLQLSDAAPFSFGLFTIPVTATSTTTTIAFRFRQDLTFWHLDDVELNEVQAVAVPEPSSILLLGAGLAGLARFRRKRRT